MQRGYARNKDEEAALKAAGVPVIYDDVNEAIRSLRAGDELATAYQIDIWTQKKANVIGCNCVDVTIKDT